MQVSGYSHAGWYAGIRLARLCAGSSKMNTPKAGKIAGVAFVGFIATAFAATKFDFSPATSQMAGFVGALLGSLVANVRRPKRSRDPKTPNQPAR